jgi:hypothetical protein
VLYVPIHERVAGRKRLVAATVREAKRDCWPEGL